VYHCMPTELPRVLITLDVPTYLNFVERAAMNGRSLSKEGQIMIGKALEKPIEQPAEERR
jgi:hypothetical protein